VIKPAVEGTGCKKSPIDPGSLLSFLEVVTIARQSLLDPLKEGRDVGLGQTAHMAEIAICQSDEQVVRTGFVKKSFHLRCEVILRFKRERPGDRRAYRQVVGNAKCRVCLGREGEMHAVCRHQVELAIRQFLKQRLIARPGRVMNIHRWNALADLLQGVCCERTASSRHSPSGEIAFLRNVLSFRAAGEDVIYLTQGA
jgi:hypothetical protein